MKRVIMLFASLALIAAMLCGCAQKAEDGVKDAASAVNSEVDNLFETRATESPMRDEQTVPPTEYIEPTEDISFGDAIATELQDMIDDGKVEDGDGNVGELENNDGDANTDE